MHWEGAFSLVPLAVGTGLFSVIALYSEQPPRRTFFPQEFNKFLCLLLMEDCQSSPPHFSAILEPAHIGGRAPEGQRNHGGEYVVGLPKAQKSLALAL